MPLLSKEIKTDKIVCKIKLSSIAFRRRRENNFLFLFFFLFHNGITILEVRNHNNMIIWYDMSNCRCLSRTCRIHTWVLRCAGTDRRTLAFRCGATDMEQTITLYLHTDMVSTYTCKHSWEMCAGKRRVKNRTSLVVFHYYYYTTRLLLSC